MNPATDPLTALADWLAEPFLLATMTRIEALWWLIGLAALVYIWTTWHDACLDLEAVKKAPAPANVRKARVELATGDEQLLRGVLIAEVALELLVTLSAFSNSSPPPPGLPRSPGALVSPPLGILIQGALAWGAQSLVVARGRYYNTRRPRR